MDKQATRLAVRDNIVTMTSAIKKALSARDAYRAQLAKLEAQKETMRAEYIESESAKARGVYMRAQQALWPEVEKALDSLSETLDRAHNAISLSGPELANAIAIIKAIGPAMTSEDQARVNAQFAGDQASLRMLKAAYTSVGITFTRELDAQLYSAGDMLEILKAYAHAALMQDGSLNSFAGQLKKLAELEGAGDLVPESLVDLEGFYGLMASAAGLGNVKIAPDGSVSFGR